MVSIELPVSIGEAIDKLTILDIKCKKIANAADSKKEYDVLYEKLREHVETYKFYYDILYRVNEEIWDMQDAIHKMKVTDGQFFIDILNKNDMRFRIKDNINKLTKSYFREQKGYPARRALFIGHLGLGDHIYYNGAVRYAALQHDQVDVIVKANNYENVKAMYADNPAIKFIVLPGSTNNGYTVMPTATTPGECYDYDPLDYTTVYRSGFYTYPRNEFNDLPIGFYKDMNMDPSIRHIYFHIPNTQRAEELYKKVKDMKYIFVQQKSSDNFVNLVKWDKNEVLTIDPNINVYSKEDPWYELAESFVGLPFFDYIGVIQNAEEIHTVDSSFYALSCYIKPKASVKKCYTRDTGILIPSYTFI